MGDVQWKGGCHERKSIGDNRTSTEVPGGVRGCVAQWTLEDFWSLVCGVKSVAGHVPIQMEPGNVPAV